MGDTDANVPLSLWERLFEDTPDPAQDRIRHRAQRLREYRRSVMQDVRNLLNTRQTGPAVPPVYRHVLNSLRTFGLPDVTSLSLRNKSHQSFLRLELENTLRKFEPRLAAVTVTLEPEETGLTLRFHVQALLRMDPEPELISFETLLEQQNAHFLVKGDAL